MRFQLMLSALPGHLAPDQLFDRYQARLATVAMVVLAQMEVAGKGWEKAMAIRVVRTEVVV